MKLTGKKSIPIYFLICVFLIAILCLAIAGIGYAEEEDVTNITVNETQFKVFVGGSIDATVNSNLTSQKAEIAEIASYITTRTTELNTLAKQKDNTLYSAIILLDDYYDETTVAAELANYNVTMIRGYMWIPGKTGRIIFPIKENDLIASVKSSLDECAEAECDDPTMKADMDRILGGEYGIFSIVVSGTSADLKNLLECDIINFIDIEYSAEAEALAAEQNTQVRYIELPCKPDGAN